MRPAESGQACDGGIMGQRGQGWDGEAQGPVGAQGRYLIQLAGGPRRFPRGKDICAGAQKTSS